MENRIKAEIERIRNDVDPNLDRKCIGLNNVTVVFFDTRKQYNLSGDQFEERLYFAQKGSCFDPYYSGCYIVPGEVTTLRAIHIRALECRLKEKLVSNYFDYHYDTNGVPTDVVDLYNQYLPNL